MYKQLQVYAVLIFLSLVFAACGKEPAPNNNNKKDEISFKEKIVPLLNSSCGTKHCHAGDEPVGKLDLSKDHYKNIVGIDSAKYGKKQIVVGDPKASLIYLKILNDKERPTEVESRMPTGKSLSASEIKLFETWIKEGAKNN